MMDFYEGWELRNRLIADGFLSPDENIKDGIEMDLKIEALAREHYNWKGKEPSSSVEVINAYREMLEQQTPSDRLCHIFDIAIDYDGYRTYRGCARLLDEIIACTQVETKTENQVLNEIMAFNKYKNCDEFLYAKESQIPYCWSFPISKWKEVDNWCDNNNYIARFLCTNCDMNGQTVAVALKIDRKDINNDIV